MTKRANARAPVRRIRPGAARPLTECGRRVRAVLTMCVLTWCQCPEAGAQPPAAWCSVPPEQARAALAARLARLDQQKDRAPQPVAGVHTEHTLQGDPDREQSIVAERDLDFMLEEALAWRAGAGSDHLAIADRFLSAWVTTYQPDFNPIDETRFDALIETYAITRDALSKPTRKASEQLLRSWATGYLDRMDDALARGARQASWVNNWQSHRVKLVTMMAAALQDHDLFVRARMAARRQLAVNLRPAGETLDFGERDALHYVVYDLEPLLRASLVAASVGEDWYHLKAKASLADAVAWLLPYANRERQHQEFVHSTVSFDAERARHGEKGYSGLFDPKNAAQAMWLAASLDPSYLPVAKGLGAAPDFLAACGR